MKRGRQTCRILKEIRRQIAEANDIEYVTSECRYQGECQGTCPKCEAEVRWLEEQLRHRSATGKLIRVAGISAGILAISAAGSCISSDPPAPIAPPPPSESNLIWGDMPENDPQFPGGQAALLQYVSDHLQYPERCQKEGIQGRVVVQFLILKDGRVDSVKVVRGKDPDLDAEAIRVIRTLPKFSPGSFNGKLVDYWYTLPITFKLTEQNETPEAGKPTENQIPNDSLRQS